MEIIKYRSKYYGVTFRADRNIFWCSVTVSGKTKYIGSAKDEKEVAIMRDKYIRDNNLKHRLNFPNPCPESEIPNTKLIRLTRGLFAIVDEEDFEEVNKYTWHAKKDDTTFYAVTHYYKNGKKALMGMHQFIFNDLDIKLDHINRNGLHNYKSNLRPCTHSQNCLNKSKQKNRSSKYKGVSWNKHDKKFKVSIMKDGKSIHLGCFSSEDDAGRCYDTKAIELFGEFAWLNFPNN